jgi:hypothetical protein
MKLSRWLLVRIVEAADTAVAVAADLAVDEEVAEEVDTVVVDDEMIVVDAAGLTDVTTMVMIVEEEIGKITIEIQEITPLRRGDFYVINPYIGYHVCPS